MTDLTDNGTDFNGATTSPVTVPDNGEPVIASGGNGEVRRGFQALANRTRWAFNKVTGILFGTLSHKAISVDGTGDLTVAPPAGTIQSTGNVRSLTSFTTTAGADVLDAEPYRVRWTGTTNTAGGTNPPLGAFIANQLRAVNTPKGWGYFVTNAMGSYSVFEGIGVTNAPFLAGPPAAIQVNMTTPMDSANYAVTVTSASLGYFCNAIPINSLSFKIVTYRIDTQAIVDPASVVVTVAFHIFGRMTT